LEHGKVSRAKNDREVQAKKYPSKKFLMEFPVKANPKIEPHKAKIFDDVDITSNDTPKQKFLNIQLVRNKTPEEINKQKID
jgi:hypothetical protein